MNKHFDLIKRCHCRNLLLSYEMILNLILLKLTYLLSKLTLSLNAISIDLIGNSFFLRSIIVSSPSQIILASECLERNLFILLLLSYLIKALDSLKHLNFCSFNNELIKLINIFTWSYFFVGILITLAFLIKTQKQKSNQN